jgi:hypothetical protein
LSGRAYHAYEAEQNYAPVAFNPHKCLNWALDFNIDPISSVLLQDRRSFAGYIKTP